MWWTRPPPPRGRVWQPGTSRRALIPPRDAATGNRLLDSIPAAACASIVGESEGLTLTAGEVLFEPGEPIRRVLFIQEGVASVVAGENGEPGIEYSAVGREGMVGLPLFLGARSFSNARVVTQVSGRALELDGERFASHSTYGRPLHAVLMRYGQYLLDQASQTAACNNLHPIDQRFAKWLLFINDRVEGESWRLPDEFLMDMLGVGEPAVRRVAAAFETEDLIAEGPAGLFEILDREGLETVACDCYRVGTDAYAVVGAA